MSGHYQGWSGRSPSCTSTEDHSFFAFGDTSGNRNVEPAARPFGFANPIELAPSSCPNSDKKRQTHFQALGSVHTLLRDIALYELPIISLISDISVVLAGDPEGWWLRGVSYASSGVGTAFGAVRTQTYSYHYAYRSHGFANPYERCDI